MTQTVFRTSLVCSLVTGFAFEASTVVSELAELATYLLDREISPEDVASFSTGIRMECMMVVLPQYPNLPTELDVVQKGTEQSLAEAIELYGESLELKSHASTAIHRWYYRRENDPRFSG